MTCHLLCIDRANTLTPEIEITPMSTTMSMDLQEQFDIKIILFSTTPVKKLSWN
jgi:hypothetical protein